VFVYSFYFSTALSATPPVAQQVIETMSAVDDAPEIGQSRWTDDQESALLQAIIRWKPVGMHKHFRMIAIREHLLNRGIIRPDDAHTTTAGVWAKLGTLFDLARLDEREDSIVDGLDEDSETLSYWRDFELPRDDFEELMWQKRLAPEGASSPATSRRESTVADTDEPRSSPVSTRGSVRGGPKPRRGGRLSRLQAELETEKSSRRTSKANSVADEDKVMEDADEDEDEENESAEEEEESSEHDEEERKTEPRRGRGGRRGRGRRGRRR
jgi:MRG-binding protein